MRTTTGFGQNAAAIVPMPSDEALDEEVLAVGIAADQPLELARGSRDRSTCSGCSERQRMGLDRLADDELHARQPDAVVGQERRLEGEVGIAEVDHDLGRRAGELADLVALDVEADLARGRRARCRPRRTRP